MNTARKAGAAANHAATNKNTKYSQLSNTRVFVPVAIETGGTWHHQAVELVQEIGRRTAIITGDAREFTFLFQQLSLAGGMRFHFKTRSQPASSLQSVVSFSYCLNAYTLCAGGPVDQKNNNSLISIASYGRNSRGAACFTAVHIYTGKR